MSSRAIPGKDGSDDQQSRFLTAAAATSWVTQVVEELGSRKRAGHQKVIPHAGVSGPQEEELHEEVGAAWAGALELLLRSSMYLK
jgi:hypothetical protein